MRITLLVITFLITNIIVKSQNLPTFIGAENRKFYVGMYNDIIINPNNSDPNMIKLKAGTSTLRKLNDTTYQIYIRDPQQPEEKVKLYYKNLPVDVLIAEIDQSPKATISIKGGVKPSYSIEEFSKIEFDFSPEDPYFYESGYTFFSITAKILRNNNTLPFMAITASDFGQSARYKNRLMPGDRVFLSDARMKSPANQTVAMNCNYVEFLIK